MKRIFAFIIFVNIISVTNAQWFWQNPLPQGNTLFDVKFISSTVGWAVGQYGTILKTTNGGTNWTSQSSGTTNDLFGVSFTDLNNGTAVGYDYNNHLGIILRTTNGGTTWTAQTSGTSNPLHSVSFTDSNNGTAVGNGGAILRTTNGGATFIEEEQIGEIPTEFLLSQNYPNPFNPSTKIKYSVPNYSSVVIKVHDILGNEIETLVNEEKPAGTYELTWNAENLPSGVYFYRLQAGDFVETKKMILLK